MCHVPSQKVSKFWNLHDAPSGASPGFLSQSVSDASEKLSRGWGRMILSKWNEVRGGRSVCWLLSPVQLPVIVIPLSIHNLMSGSNLCWNWSWRVIMVYKLRWLEMKMGLTRFCIECLSYIFLSPELVIRKETKGCWEQSKCKLCTSAGTLAFAGGPIEHRFRLGSHRTPPHTFTWRMEMNEMILWWWWWWVRILLGLLLPFLSLEERQVSVNHEFRLGNWDKRNSSLQSPTYTPLLWNKMERVSRVQWFIMKENGMTIWRSLSSRQDHHARTKPGSLNSSSSPQFRKAHLLPASLFQIFLPIGHDSTLPITVPDLFPKENYLFRFTTLSRQAINLC